MLSTRTRREATARTTPEVLFDGRSMRWLEVGLAALCAFAALALTALR